ncbi:UPF0462 protein C4orf33 homolog [Tubulanus polymorphus]|uniref:UPF0462 protein C4orf33 homolog n=1 Tax=Tubulanus polymorphus TaxID=672921 RepID=UPI003DA3F141
MSSFKFTIDKQWDSTDVNHDKRVEISLEPSTDNNSGSLIIKITAPFFDDPARPDGEPGEPFPQLWDYEVVEVFFLGDDEKYLEVELSPHGQHLVLLLNGCRKCFKDQLSLKYTARIDGTQWSGEAVLPADYFPPNVSKLNAYAIYGSGNNRQYEALYPVPKDLFSQPDFHRLEYFQSIDFKNLVPSTQNRSDYWKNIT